MSLANPLWGAPRIHGELLKLGIDIGETTVAKYMTRPRRPSSQTWKTFLKNHMHDIVSTDFVVVPTATFRLLFVFLILSHDRRRIAHLLSLPIPRLNGRHNSSSPRSLGTHHLDIYCVTAMEAMADRFRKLFKRCRFRKFSQLHVRLGRMLMSRDSLVPSERDCLHHVLVFHERGLRRILKSYFDYYERSRTHLSLSKDAPIPRPVQLPSCGEVIERPLVGGLHHRYERRAA
jgi:hypothetical protein